MKLKLEGEMINVTSAYTPQVGCETEVKDNFWSDMNEIVEGFLLKEEFSDWSRI